MRILAKDDLVVLSMWDEREEKEVVSISLVQNDHENFMSLCVDDNLCFSLNEWDALAEKIQSIIKDPARFIENNKAEA